jgi:hypothetical protein
MFVRSRVCSVLNSVGTCTKCWRNFDVEFASVCRQERTSASRVSAVQRISERSDSTDPWQGHMTQNADLLTVICASVCSRNPPHQGLMTSRSVRATTHSACSLEKICVCSQMTGVLVLFWDVHSKPRELLHVFEQTACKICRCYYSAFLVWGGGGTWG